MLLRMNPQAIRPTRGMVIVEILEQLGGQTASGIHLHAGYEDKHDKDTCYSRVVKIGPLPDFHYGRSGQLAVKVEGSLDPGTVAWRDGGKTWTENHTGVKPGDVVLHPRDVPKVFVWSEESDEHDKAYALVYLHELLAVLDDFEPGMFRQLSVGKSAMEGL